MLSEHAFLYAHAAGEDAANLLADCLAQLGDIPEHANLGFIYVTDSLQQYLEIILTGLRGSTGVQHWVGTSGDGICALGQEYYAEPAMALMIGSFAEDAFMSVPGISASVDSFVAAHSDWLEQDTFHFGILHGDPGNAELSRLLKDLSVAVPNGFFVGGLSSGRDRFPQVAKEVTSGGISGVLFNSEVAVVTGHSQGCTPIAANHVITACDQNIIIELDGRPALEVFKQDVGEVITKDLHTMAAYIFVGLAIPGSDTGDYLVRNLLGVDPENQLLAISDSLSKGQEIMFCRRDGNTAYKDMQRMLLDIKSRLPSAPKGAVYHSCLARGRHQFGEHSEELRLIRDHFAHLPLVGFFANGEFFHDRIYGYTGVLTVFC